jgi:sugar phosphate isomerase/epimerase
MFKYSYDSLVYFGEPVEQSIARLARFGYDAIELIGEPDKYDRKEVNKLLGITASKYLPSVRSSQPTVTWRRRTGMGVLMRSIM